MAAVSAPNPLAAAATAAATSSRGPLVTLELSSRSTATAVATSDAAGTPAPEGAVDAFGKRHKRAVYPSERTKTFTDAAYSIFVTILAVPLATIEDSEGKTSAQLLAERFLPVTVFALSSVLVVVVSVSSGPRVYAPVLIRRGTCARGTRATIGSHTIAAYPQWHSAPARHSPALDDTRTVVRRCGLAG